MRLYHCSQVPQTVGLRNRRDRACWTLPPSALEQPDRDQDRDIGGQPRNPLLRPALGPGLQRSLHQELLFCCRRGLLPRKKPELQSVLERRHREERDRRERPLSDLDRHMQSRRLWSKAKDSEEKQRRRQSIPEFIRIKGTLKHIPGFCL